MLARYDDWGIARIGGTVNDEPLVAIAMACAGLEAVPDGGRITRTLAGIHGPLRVDVFRGAAPFRKYDDLVQPAIIHFAAGAWTQLEYRREAVRLALHARGVPVAALAPLPPLSRAALAVARPLLRRRRRRSQSLAVDQT